MSKQPSKVRTHFYSVAIATGRSRKKDFTAQTEKIMGEIEALAEAQALTAHVTLKKDDESLAKLGIFFMNAPERFAEEVKGMDGIKSVEKPAARNKATGTKSTRSRLK